MCGIAGRFDLSSLAPAPQWRERAAALLAHRGPDGEGQFSDTHCELVHRRLALIDLSPTGSQPLANEDGRILIIYNGEIYNHRELRVVLERQGHVFRGTSDTEVIVHLYEEVGERVAEHLRGIFAFAIYDRHRRSLLLARDRFGVKPLFYSTIGTEWVFASEIKAIAAHPQFRPVLDRQACYDYLGLGYVPEPATGFANVRALRPGTTLRVGPHGGQARESVFHRTTVRPDVDRLREGEDERATDDVALRLIRAVEAQAVADVPVAALLSGGIDSSLVVAAHSRTNRRTIATFNVRFPDAADDETQTALAVAERYGTKHEVVDLPEQALSPDGMLDLLRHFDQPFADTSFIPTYGVCRAIRDQGIICTLSGDGGDEAFGGYPSFWRLQRLVQLMRLPEWLRHAARDAGNRLAGWTQDFGRQVSKAVALAQSGREMPAVLFAGLANYLNENQKAELVPQEARFGLEPVYRLYESDPEPEPGDLEALSERLTRSLFEVSLPSDMLRKVDMMSMRASIEVRVPLLDESVVDLGLSLPHRLKTDGQTGKRVLRSLARRWLPRSVANHPKHGFQIPLDRMVPQGFHSALDDLLLAPGARTRGVFDRALLRRWLCAFRERAQGGTVSRGGLYQRVFTALGLEMWLREFQLAW
ncbi:MAG TPA: asparagine synthase (glutamine-hydrolyzing) [Gemmatimonadales bacterium]|nr:asparagine synthase (glutamine-hydrolyzing) [Gemmatimonadales bacterium]